MSVSSVSGSNYFAPNSTTQDSTSQVRNNLQSLFSALENGNTTAAQSALATLQQEKPGLFSNPSSPLSSLAKNVQSGNITAAQQELSQLQGATQSQPHKHHGMDGAPSEDENVGNLLNVTV